MPAFSLPHTPQPLTGLLPRMQDAPLPKPATTRMTEFATASAVYLAPLHYRRETTRPVSYYALFQGWLLLSQPPGCLRDHTSFPT